MSAKDFAALADFVRQYGWELVSAKTETTGDVAREWSGFTALKLVGFLPGRITSVTQLEMVALRSNFEAERWLSAICMGGQQLLPHLVVTARGPTQVDRLKVEDRRGETMTARVEVTEIEVSP